MKVKDLIAELARFNPDDSVCVEVTFENVRAYVDGNDVSANFTIDTVMPENDQWHNVKLTIV